MEVLIHRDRAPRQKEETDLSTANSQKLIKLHSVMDALLRKVMVRGFHGEATVKITVHDGTIQLIEECVERKHR